MKQKFRIITKRSIYYTNKEPDVTYLTGGAVTKFYSVITRDNGKEEKCLVTILGDCEINAIEIEE